MDRLSLSFSFTRVRAHIPWTWRRLNRRHSLSYYCGNITLSFSSSSSSQSSSLLGALSTKQKEQVSLYIDTLLDWNQRMNLTGVTEWSEVVKRHVEDSLSILPVIRERCSAVTSTVKLVDVGSGAGLPGLIMAIACPDWHFTLLDSMHKRCLFLEHAIRVSGLLNVQVVCARAEEEVENAKKAIRVLGASVLQSCCVESKGPYGQRTAVVCMKDSPTPKKYPRQPGLPAKKPL
ncbi:uncharacterized protein LOC18427358 isoform X5 [Amborella trichopoda]|uniref:uncharacterized protein LOC18427358 isoform X5 n=1 Tax=Amborella trichopoda TaxID=13333 RepID=UPI0005D3350B|nr:uncharacterized protein LOC18427358 isoform X5 [Amborella trichopoda]|eukprot:XP_011620835.1 uncharacterized protein LOC18427358 isoform X5 [Amborella trichopoda]